MVKLGVVHFGGGAKESDGGVRRVQWVLLFMISACHPQNRKIGTRHFPRC